MRIALVVLLMSALFASAVFAQSEASTASVNQAKALFLMQAGLPDNIYDIIGQKFTFFYDRVPAGWNSISGIVWGIDFRPRKEIDVFVSITHINGNELHWLVYKQVGQQWGWYAKAGSTSTPGELFIQPANPPARSK